jgi:hypothetical protein
MYKRFLEKCMHKKKQIQHFCQETLKRDHLKDIGVDWRIILKLIIEK